MIKRCSPDISINLGFNGVIIVFAPAASIIGREVQLKCFINFLIKIEISGWQIWLGKICSIDIFLINTRNCGVCKFLFVFLSHKSEPKRYTHMRLHGCAFYEHNNSKKKPREIISFLCCCAKRIIFHLHFQLSNFISISIPFHCSIAEKNLPISKSQNKKFS